MRGPDEEVEPEGLEGRAKDFEGPKVGSEVGPIESMSVVSMSGLDVATRGLPGEKPRPTETEPKAAEMKRAIQPSAQRPPAW